MDAQSKTKFAEQLELAGEVLPASIDKPNVLKLLELSLAEDLAPGGLENFKTPLSNKDLTSFATISPGSQLKGKIFVKQPGVIAGLPLAELVFKLLDPEMDFEKHVQDGAAVVHGQEAASVSGKGRALLAGERTALNFLGRMSGIATLTRRYVEAVAHTRAKILDTRKTTPGWRLLEKYAVRMGGGVNHRMGLYDEVLIKNNHIDAAGGVAEGIKSVQERYGDRYPVVVEVRTLDELETALAYRPTRILLDNMDNDTMRRAVQTSAGSVPLEASGNVNLETVAAIAETGVDYISSGALTHSAPVLDISMHLQAY